MRSSLAAGLLAATVLASGGVSHARPWTGYQQIPATRMPEKLTLPAGAPQIIYLNHTGITLTPGNDNSSANTSSIINSSSQIAAWNISAANWASVLSCVQDEFSRFNVTVTDVDPGSAVHIEAVFGGNPQDIGMQQGVGGVSPWTGDCSTIPRSIVFIFTEVFSNQYEEICEVAAQEISHSYGLDHEYLASDPMTYLSYNGHKTFQDKDTACGEYSSRACQCSSTQNSVQMLLQRIGAKQTTTDNPPTVSITSPSDGATVQPGFTVGASASDDNAVTKVELRIDGALVGTDSSAPYSFTTAQSLGDGAHTIEARAYDSMNQTANASISVTVQTPGGGGSGSGSGSGSGNPGDGSGSDGDGWTTGGCAAGGGGAGASLALGLGLAMALRRRRR